MAANMPVVDLLKRFAEKKNATPSQIALAFSIPGTRHMDHLNENLGALKCSADVCGFE
jgi:aryl-alcohol dehydrogenase-like predicted oxidoreductase